MASGLNSAKNGLHNKSLTVGEHRRKAVHEEIRAQFLNLLLLALYQHIIKIIFYKVSSFFILKSSLTRFHSNIF